MSSELETENLLLLSTCQMLMFSCIYLRFKKKKNPFRHQQSSDVGATVGLEAH